MKKFEWLKEKGNRRILLFVVLVFVLTLLLSSGGKLSNIFSSENDKIIKILALRSKNNKEKAEKATQQLQELQKDRKQNKKKIDSLNHIIIQNENEQNVNDNLISKAKTQNLTIDDKAIIQELMVNNSNDDIPDLLNSVEQHYPFLNPVFNKVENYIVSLVNTIKEKTVKIDSLISENLHLRRIIQDQGNKIIEQEEIIRKLKEQIREKDLKIKELEEKFDHVDEIYKKKYNDSINKLTQELNDVKEKLDKTTKAYFEKPEVIFKNSRADRNLKYVNPTSIEVMFTLKYSRPELAPKNGGVDSVMIDYEIITKKSNKKHILRLIPVRVGELTTDQYYDEKEGFGVGVYKVTLTLKSHPEVTLTFEVETKQSFFSKVNPFKRLFGRK